MKLRELGLIFLIIIGLMPSMLFSQPIVQVTKSNSIILNKLEALQVNLCFEMDDYLVVSPAETSLLDEANIDYRLLTSDNEINPLYLISGKAGVKLQTQPYLAEILIDDVLRVEKANTAKKSYLPQHGVKFVPVKVSSKLYQNKARAYKKSTDINQQNKRDFDQVLASVEADSVAWFIQKLEDFETRYALVDNRREISEWIAAQFTRFGYENVAIDSFYVSRYSTWQYNVVCIEEGFVNPDQFVVVGGHHDSIITPNTTAALTYAPGADDNASGVAAVLETARILKLHNVQNRNSIRFVTFAMEEFGLYGGYHDAEYLAENNIDVIAMLNSDMISSHYITELYTFTIRAYPGAESLTNLAHTKGWELDMNTLVFDTSLSGSDSWAYHVNGIPAIFFSENDFSPYYHSDQDISENTNPYYAAQFIKLIASVTMSTSNLIVIAENFTVQDAGDGSTIIASWDEVEEEGITYLLDVENLTTNDIISYNTEETSYTITDLTSGTPYKVTLYSTLDELSSFGEVRFITPQNIPAQVENFVYTPELNQINFSWSSNLELDLSAYKLYRKNTEDTEFSLIATIPANENNYSDLTTESGVWYNYKITAIDEDGNESQATDIITVRHLSFDSGIGVYDFTTFSDNNLLYPAQELVEDFYAVIFSNYDYDLIICDPQEELKIEDLGIYSTIVIFKNSFTSISNTHLKNTLEEYLAYGGNVLISTSDPIRFLDLNSNTYPKTFVQGDFVYDRFGISQVDFNSTARLARAQSLAWDIPDLMVDADKIFPTFNGRIYNVEAFSTPSLTSIENIFSYQSDSDNSSQNIFDDYIVAVSKSYENSKTVITSIPLYFMEAIQAEEFTNSVFAYFDESVENESNETVPGPPTLRLSNYPNPFNPSTTIRFNLPMKSNIDLKIYNLKGQLVKSIYKSNLTSGNHTITWNGDNDKGNKLSSGIYLYKLKTDSGLSQTRRMLLIK